MGLSPFAAAGTVPIFAAGTVRSMVGCENGTVPFWPSERRELREIPLSGHRPIAYSTRPARHARHAHRGHPKRHPADPAAARVFRAGFGGAIGPPGR